MRLILTCDGSHERVKCCQGAAVAICTLKEFKQFENSSQLLLNFKEKKLRDPLAILGIILSLPTIKQGFPVLEVIDFFSYHRKHDLYLEISE